MVKSWVRQDVQDIWDSGRRETLRVLAVYVSERKERKMIKDFTSCYERIHTLLLFAKTNVVKILKDF